MRPVAFLVGAAALCGTACAENVAAGAELAAMAAAHKQGLAAAFQYGRPETKWAPAGVPWHESSGYTGEVPALFLELHAAADDARVMMQDAAAAKEDAMLRSNTAGSSSSSMRGRHSAASGGRSLEMMPPPAMPGTAVPGGAPSMQQQQQQQPPQQDGRNAAAEAIISDPDSIASKLSARTKKVPHSWFGKGLFLAPTYQIATGQEECDVCKALVEHWKELHVETTCVRRDAAAPAHAPGRAHPACICPRRVLQSSFHPRKNNNKMRRALTLGCE